MKKRGLRVALVALAVVAAKGAAETTEERLAYLEKEVQSLKIAADSAAPFSGVNLGGYGELHYNNLSGSGGASGKDEIDFHRFVLFVGYDFTDRIRFSSELELEHTVSGDGEPGEVELEQAFVDFSLNEDHTFRAGLFLLPIGIMNETHEPTTFYGVERNPVELNIIPTTWWEAGAGFYGRLIGDFSYAAYLHSGLMTSTNSSYAVRKGRQKVAKANASDFAGTFALNWKIPGVTIGGSVHYQSDISQSEDPEADEAFLTEIHTDIRKGALGLRALYARWAISGDGPKSYGADEQYGWYLEPSFQLLESVGIFARYSQWDNTAGSNGQDSKKTEYNAGINWWPIAQLVVKADYQWQDNKNGKEQNGVNVGVGYVF